MTDPLVYVSDADPGIKRRKHGRGFTYIAPDGTTIADQGERARIQALAVPPAYEDVWICSLANGHLQATGRDARRRKQYRYHPDWSAAQATAKYDQLIPFADHLPRIRRRINRDLGADPGDLEFALAAAVTMIDRASLRVGNPDYTRDNGSYGAITLRRRHLTFRNNQIDMRYTAKGGKKIKRSITDRKLQRLLHKVHDLPGATLLSWTNDAGEVQTLSSHQLNAYIADAAADDRFTAKTFRTWAGTLAAFECAEKGNKTTGQIADAAAARLYNTPTVARNSYIHPAVLDLADQEKVDGEPVNRSGLFAAERRLLGHLSRQ